LPARKDTAARLKEAMGVTPMPGQYQPQYQADISINNLIIIN
jgi:hypothetical protein